MFRWHVLGGIAAAPSHNIYILVLLVVVTRCCATGMAHEISGNRSVTLPARSTLCHHRLYGLFGVTHSATTTELQSAIRKTLARSPDHPDRESSQADRTASAKRYAELTAARALLWDPSARQEYDRDCGDVVDCARLLPNQLFVGSMLAASCPAHLIKLGIRRILSLNSEELVRDAASFEYHQLPIDDAPSQSLTAVLPAAFSLLRAAAAAREATLVHCRAGASRSASVCIAFFVCEFGICLPHALGWVRHRRSCVEPNRGFLAQLILLAQEGMVVKTCASFETVACVSFSTQCYVHSNVFLAHETTARQVVNVCWLQSHLHP